jgi:DNA-binding transcriptional regulator/RsmH inhibitor MraZ
MVCLEKSTSGKDKFSSLAKVESALLEQHTNTTFQALLGIANNCHMEHQGRVCLNAHNQDWLK